MKISLDAVISLIGLTSFGLLMLPTALRWRVKEKAILTLSLYLALGLVWNIGVAVTTLDLISTPEQFMFFDWLAAISRGVMPLVFGALTLAFLGRLKALYWYWGFGLIFLAFWVVISLNVYNAATLILAYLPGVPGVQTLVSSLEIITWSLATIIALWVLYSGFKAHPQAQYRNRFRYWFGGTLVLSLANIIILLQIPAILWVGSTLNIIGALLITYIVMRSHPPDLKFIVNRILQSLTVTLTLGLLLFAALNVAYLMNRWQVSPPNVLFWLIVIAGVAGFFLPPLSRWIEKSLSKVLFGGNFDETRTLQAYSQSVSSDWDFNKLSKQALDFIIREMGISQGALFIDKSDNPGRIALKPVTSVGMPDIETGHFPGNNPWIVHLRQQQTPVTQYDLEVLPEYRNLDEASKQWLFTLNAELFCPVILRRREMIGLLALGPKPQHKPYLPHDLERLQTLAPQIALDLDKAKLFGQLGAVNQKLGEMSGKFETFDKGKTDFLSIASHELRTPLTQIHGYASMLLEATEADLENPAYLQLVFSGIAKGSTRLKDVVDLIFDVSKAEIGELEIGRTPISLSEVVAQAALNQQAALNERRHALVVSGLEQLTMVEGDFPRLVQAVTHLLNNAIKYTPDGGTITVTGRDITDKGQPPKVELIITDTGIGIDPKDHSRIFEKFYRVGNVENHSTGTVKFKGAGPGLGLPLVNGIVGAHGGEVWVESPEYNEKTCPGSQFHLILPVKAPAVKMVKPTAAPASSLAKTRHWRDEDLKAIKTKLAEHRDSNPDQSK